MPLFVYVFGILPHLLILLSLYPWCHHGSILPLYGRGKVVFIKMFLGVNILLKGDLSVRAKRHPLWAVRWPRWLFPPLSQDPIKWRMKRPMVRTSTGIQCLCCLAVQLLSAGCRSTLSNALELKESMTARWNAVIRIMKRGDNCHHHGDGTSVQC